MSRPGAKKSKKWSVRFELFPDDDDHVRLHEHLDGLADNGNASEWIRRTLLADLVQHVAPDMAQPRSPSVFPASRLPLPRQPVRQPDHNMRTVPGQAGGFGDMSEDLDGGSANDDDDVTYEEIDNA